MGTRLFCRNSVFKLGLFLSQSDMFRETVIYFLLASGPQFLHIHNSSVCAEYLITVFFLRGKYVYNVTIVSQSMAYPSRNEAGQQ